ncbi:MAG: amidase family protein, partial [Armatimonadota bacterium]
MNLFALSAHEARDMLERREISSRELTESVLERISSVEDRVKSYVTVTADEALESARIIDERRARGEALGLLAG